MDDWLHEFNAFTPHHAVVVLACGGFMAGLAMLARSMAPAAERRLRMGWSLSVVGWQLFMLAFWLSPRNFGPSESFPLHLCDLAVWLVPVALLTEHRWARTLLYFWAIGLSTQAFATPVLTEGAGDWRYWSFWVGHTQIVGSAVYDLAVRRFRPMLGDLALAVGAGLAYAAAMFALNLRTGWNYGYVGPSPAGARTVVDALGPWPLRVVWIVLLAAFAQTLAWLPWAVARRRRR